MPTKANLNQVLTVAQMQSAEQELIDAGVSVDELMQRAGNGAADWVWRMSGGRAVTVLCGPGNNGGDGYVIAAEIARRGGAVNLVAAIPPKTEAAKNAAAHFSSEMATELGDVAGDVFVDCLFGSGLSRPLSDEHRQLVAKLQAHHSLSVAIDVPSGVDADTGDWPDGIAPFDATISLGAWKRAHWLGEAAAKSGAKRLVDIGVTDQKVAEHVAAKPTMSPPAWNAHKYRRGLVAVVGGAMPGAAVLAATSAQGAGAGYVKLFADNNVGVPPDIVLDASPLPEALSDSRIGAVLVGPGLGRTDSVREKLRAVLASGHRAVLDADALHLLDNDLLATRNDTPLVLTPHAGELAWLCDTFGIADSGKRDQALGLSERTGAAVLAKGPDTILAFQGRLTYFPQGSSWLSVAGSGDVLAGIVAARLAGGTDPALAACESVHLHHKAARQAGTAFSASQLANEVSFAFSELT